jgi:dTDP-4-amino-4,6-dideoxygalactose transaminase
MFTLLLPLDVMAITQEFVKAMHAKGIGISYEAIHLTSHFRRKGFREGQFPVSERIARETVTPPLYPEMRDADVERVCATMAQVVRDK